MEKRTLRELLSQREFFYAPGVFDMLSLHITNSIGFDAVYASGYWLTGSYLGLPDVGLAGYTDMIDRVARVCEFSAQPVIADADTGYGGLVNLRHTVRGYERAGVKGFQLEDQIFPKKCGHVANRPVIECRDMVQKIKLVLDTRLSDEMLVIARTDARTDHGLTEALDRAAAYAEAGADMVFVEAAESKDEMRKICSSLPAPVLVNMAEGGKTPILTVDELRGLGFAAAIFPGTTALTAMHTVSEALKHLRSTGSSRHPDLPAYPFREMSRLLGMDEVQAFEAEWEARR